MPILKFISLQVLLLSASSSLQVYYVKPSNLSVSCPGQPCLTIDQYSTQQSKYFTTGSAFQFLTGNHSMYTTIRLRDISDIILRGTQDATLLCKTEMAILCENVSNLTIETMVLASKDDKGMNLSALSIINSKNILLLDVKFQGTYNLKIPKRAVYFNHSNATIENCLFEGNTAHNGGAMYTSQSNITLKGSRFIENSAQHYGGAIFASKSVFLMAEYTLGNTFVRNSALDGGAVYSINSTFDVSSDGVTEAIQNVYDKVGFEEYEHISEELDLGIETASFQIPACSLCFFNNKAIRSGGAVNLKDGSVVSFGSGTVIAFHNNSASGGGAFCSSESVVTSKSKHLWITGNLGTAMLILRSNFSFSGNTKMSKNVGCMGGVVSAELSSIVFSGHTLFEENFGIAIEGGASAPFVVIDSITTSECGGAVLGMVESEFVMSGSVLFRGNNCTLGSGGALALIGNSRITFSGNITFEHNWAEMGGAIYLRDSTVILKQQTTIVSRHNYAKYYGGAIFHVDTFNYFQCGFSMSTNYQKPDILFTLRRCFLELEEFKFNSSVPYEIWSYNDLAGIDGQFLFGGLMDKCRVIDTSDNHFNFDLLYNVVIDYGILHIEPSDANGTNEISSEAYTLCLCVDSQNYNCTADRTLSTHRGQKFSVSVLALSQGDAITAPLLLATVSKTARLELNQDSQSLSANCTTVSYNMYSTEEEEVLMLYPDASCRDTGLARVFINVMFKPCPPAFNLSGDHCVCEERLQKYNVECKVGDEENYITKKAGSNFWVSTYSPNQSYEGLILCQSCPIDYCKTEEVYFTLNQPDVQCDFNHSGMLCGACSTNYSLMLGNSKCQKCSNTYLFLLLAFAAAGIALAVFISFLRLTVATGTMNSIILYANIVQANKSLLFPNSTNVNILTVFIAWMNLDLGFPTCFYHRMDAYAQTWLQFAFPIYVWVLISLIILLSRYSIWMTKVIGSNPIAVLATLLLMSYSKILKNIIQIYSSVQLEYPNMTVTVWLKDANVPYLKSRHLNLAVASSIFVALLFLPYTFFLLLGYKLYRFSRKRCFRWFMIRMKPLLDSYYAPYEDHTRYWTGFHLLVRCALYVVFSFDSVGEINNSLLAIIIAFTVMIVIARLSVKIYKSFYVNAIEALVYLNLIILSAAASNGANSRALVYALVGKVFAIMIGITVYHFHLLYIVKSAVWLKITAKLVKNCTENTATEAERAPLVLPSYTRIVTKSVVSLREPMLEEISD